MIGRALLLGLALGVGAHAVAASSAAPVLAAGAGVSQQAAWIRRHVVAGDYTAAAHDKNQLILYDPVSLRWVAEGVIEGRFRVEYFRPVSEGDQHVRSRFVHLAIRCRSLASRQLELANYAGLNLTAPLPFARPAMQWQAADPATGSDAWAKALRIACTEVDTPGLRI